MSREYFSSMLRDGRSLAQGDATYTFATAGNFAVVIRLSDLKYIEKIIQYQFETDPIVDPGSPVNEKITGNVVGMTLIGVGGGTTMVINVMGVGP